MALGRDAVARRRLYRQATAACLTAIVMMQVANVHLCRTRRAPLRTRRLLGNRVITAGIAIEIVVILLIDYTAIGGDIFGAAPIPLRIWVIILPLAMAMIVVEELRKTLVN